MQPDQSESGKAPDSNPLSWDIAQGITFCQQVEEVVRPVGWHCGLTGSVLYQGGSTKDLDIIIYPHKNTYVQSETNDFKDAAAVVLSVLEEKMGINKLINRTQVHARYGESKVVFIARTSDGRRIDVFFLK